MIQPSLGKSVISTSLTTRKTSSVTSTQSFRSLTQDSLVPSSNKSDFPHEFPASIRTNGPRPRHDSSMDVFNSMHKSFHSQNSRDRWQEFESSVEHIQFTRETLRNVSNKLRENDWNLLSAVEGSISTQRSKHMLLDVDNVTYYHTMLNASPTLIICGEVNAGKSTFVNLLLDVELLPIDELPLTNQIVEVLPPVKAESSDVIVHRKLLEGVSGKVPPAFHTDSDNVSEQLFEMMTDSTNDNSKTFIQIEFPHYLTKQGLHIIECPGVDGIGTYVPIVESLKRNPLSVVVFVMDITDRVTKVAEHFLKFIKKQFPQTPVFFLLNKLDAEDENVLRHDNPLNEIKSWKASSMELEVRFISKFFDDLLYFDWLVQPKADQHEALNIAPVSLLNAENDSNDSRFFVVMERLSLFCRHGFWQLLFPIHCQLQLLVEAVTSKVIRANSDSQCQLLLHCLKERARENQRERQEMIKLVKVKLQNERRSIVDDIMEVVRIPGHNLKRHRHISDNDNEMILTEKMERRMLQKVEQALRRETGVQRKCSEARKQFLSQLSADLEGIASRSNSDNLQIVNFILLLFHWKKMFMSSARISLNSRVIFEEEKLLQQVKQAWTRYLRNATGKEDTVFSLKSRRNIAENLFSRINADKTISANFDSQSDLLVHLQNTIKQYMHVQQFIQNVIQKCGERDISGILSSFFLLGAHLNGLANSIRRGNFLDFITPVSLAYAPSQTPTSTAAAATTTSWMHPSLFQPFKAELAGDSMMMRLVPLEQSFSSSAEQTTVNYQWLYEFGKIAEKSVLTFRDTLLTRHHLLLLIPRMDTDLFVLLTRPNSTRSIGGLCFDSCKLRLGILCQIMDASLYLQSKLGLESKCIDLSPQFVLMTFLPNDVLVRLYFYDNVDIHRPYPNSTGPWHRLWKTNSSDYDWYMQCCVLLWWLALMQLLPPPMKSVMEEEFQYGSNIREVVGKVQSLPLDDISENDVIILGLVRNLLVLLSDSQPEQGILELVRKYQTRFP